MTKKILDFDVYSPLTDIERKNTTKMDDNDLTRKSSCKYKSRHNVNEIFRKKCFIIK